MGEGGLVATVVASDVDGGFRSWGGEEQGSERERAGRSERGRGCVASREEPGEEEAAGGGSRRWRSGAGASTRLCLLAEVEDGGELGWASATVLGRKGR